MRSISRYEPVYGDLVTVRVEQKFTPTYENGVVAPGSFGTPYRKEMELIVLPVTGLFRELQKRYGKCLKKKVSSKGETFYWFRTWTPGVHVRNQYEPYDPTRIETRVIVLNGDGRYES